MLNSDGKRDVNAEDIDAAVQLFWTLMSVMTGLLIIASLIGLVSQLI